MGYSPWGHKDSDTTAVTEHTRTHLVALCPSILSGVFPMNRPALSSNLTTVVNVSKCHSDTILFFAPHSYLEVDS